MAKRHILQNILYPLLYPISRIYAFCARLKRTNTVISQSKTDIPPYLKKHICISIGNISWGGTGKTPIIDLLLSYFERRDPNIPHVILTRGYGAKPPFLPFRVSSNSKASESGDEPLMLYKKHPNSIIMVDPVRTRSLQFLENKNIQYGCILLDDGFQHTKVMRDINIVLLDADDISFNPLPGHSPSNWDRVIPAGTWREGEEALSHATFFLIKILPEELNKITVDLSKRLSKFKKNIFPFYLKPIGLRQILPALQIDDFSLKDSSIIQGQYLVLTGIGNPEQALKTIESFMQRPASETLFFPDHCDFSKKISILKSIDKPIICTTKDAVKLKEIPFSVPCYSIETTPVFYDMISYTNDYERENIAHSFSDILEQYISSFSEKKS